MEELSKAELYQRVVDPADPNRCQANMAFSQCNIRAVPGTKYCMLHGGAKAIASKKRKSHNMYRLGKWQERVREMGESKNVKSLRDEIGILRMLLEERFATINNSTELLIQSHTLSELNLKIERVVLSCHKVEKSMGDLIDRSEIIRFADLLNSAVQEVLVDHPQLAGDISEKFQAIIQGDEDDEENSD